MDTQRYPVQAFKALYHTRWQIGEGFKRQKFWLEIENFTGKSVLSVQQDYHVRILSLNLTAIAVFAAQRHPDQMLPHRKYRYQINLSQALSTMKDTIVKCLYGLISMQGYEQLVETMRQSLTIIRSGRRFERKKRSGARKNVVITNGWRLTHLRDFYFPKSLISRSHRFFKEIIPLKSMVFS